MRLQDVHLAQAINDLEAPVMEVVPHINPAAKNSNSKG